MCDLTFVEDAKASATHVSAMGRGFPEQLRKLKKMVQLEAFATCKKLEFISVDKKQIKKRPSPELKKKLR